MTMFTQRSTTVATRALCMQQIREFSTPKLHKAKGNWDALKSKRPIDHDDLHTVFHPPFNKGTVIGLSLAVLGIGIGTMQYGFVHQQYKQGYWK